jgi:uncharacterized membrane protein
MAESSTNSASAEANLNNPEQVWSYRGYKMRPGEFNTAMVHFYRGEITRSNVWRSRLDSTTNWAVVTVGAVLTFAFGSIDNSHVVILISFLLVLLFLVVESRRYRYYELWALRVRLMETDFFAAMLIPPFAPHQEWASRLADSLLAPEFPITLMEAMGRRLRRNYAWLFLILAIAWTFKLLLHPIPARSFESFLNHATIGFIPGEVVALAVGIFLFITFLISLYTAKLQDSPGEVLPRYRALELSSSFLQNIANAAGSILPDDLPFMQQHEHLTLIITDKAEAVSQQLLSVLKRGVTGIEGRGMYTGKPRTVLLCVVAPSQIDHLKTTVYAVDENAFVVVNPTEEFLGAGFGPRQPRWRRNKNKPAAPQSFGG